MPQYSENSDYNSVSLGFGPVQRRPIIRKNLDAFAQSINKIDEAHREAIKQRTAIDVALGQIQLDHAEDGWKYQYIERIKDTIDDAAMFGSYSTALSTATIMAGKAVSSPELLGRQRAHQDHTEWEKKIDSRNDIEALTKMRFKDQNPYHYEDKYDEYGNIIGGTKWEPNSEPVSDVTVESIADLAFKMISPDQKSVSTQSSHGDSKDGVHSTSGSSSSHKYTRVRASDIEEVANMILSDPSNAAAMQQRYDNYIWRYGDIKKRLDDASTTEEERQKLMLEQATIWDDIKNEQGTGIDYNYRPWLNKKIKLYAKHRAYNWTEDATGRHSDVTETNGGSSRGLGGILNGGVSRILNGTVTAGTLVSSGNLFGTNLYNMSNTFENNWVGFQNKKLNFIGQGIGTNQ